MYSEAPHTALRFVKENKPVYSTSDWLDLHCMLDRIIPFQIRRTSRPNPLTVFKLISLDDVTEVDLLAILTTPPTIVSFVGFDVIMYKADINSAIDFPQGRWYVKVSDGIDYWYSLSVLNIPCYATISPVPPPLDDGMGSQIEDIIIND